MGEGVGRPPGSRSAGGSLLHHLVDLLESKTLGLWHEEVSVDERSRAQATPHEEDGRAEVALVLADHVRSNNRNDGVPEPVGCSRKGNTTRADRQREHLANDDPSTGTPSACKEEDEDGDEGDLGVDGRDVVGTSYSLTSDNDAVGVVESNGDTDDGNKELEIVRMCMRARERRYFAYLADEHTECSPNQKWATTKLLNGVEGNGSGADVHEGENQGDEESVADGTGGLQEWGRVVEDEVDTGPLLHHLERSTENSLAEVGALVPERTLEAVGPAGDPSRGRNESALVFLVGDNLGKLRLDVLGVRRLATDFGKSGAGFLDVTALNKVTRGVGQEQKTGTENDAPGELDTDRNAVRTSVGAIADGVVDAGSDKKTESNAKLVTSNQCASNLAGADFGHVENDNGRLETDTETGNDTTDDEESKTGRGDLENNSDQIDDTSCNDGPLAADDIGSVTSNDGTEESTSGKDRDDERGVRTGDGGGANAFNVLNEVRRVQDTVDVTGIITEENTTERRESAELQTNESVHQLES